MSLQAELDEDLARLLSHLRRAGAEEMQRVANQVLFAVRLMQWEASILPVIGKVHLFQREARRDAGTYHADSRLVLMYVSGISERPYRIRGYPLLSLGCFNSLVNHFPVRRKKVRIPIEEEFEMSPSHVVSHHTPLWLFWVEHWEKAERFLGRPLPPSDQLRSTLQGYSGSESWSSYIKKYPVEPRQ